MDDASGATNALTFEVWRGGEDGHYVAYTVPHQEKQTVLDAVTYIQPLTVGVRASFHF